MTIKQRIFRTNSLMVLFQKIENMDFSAGDWEQYAKAVQPYDFHLIVRDENGKEL